MHLIFVLDHLTLYWLLWISVSKTVGSANLSILPLEELKAGANKFINHGLYYPKQSTDTAQLQQGAGQLANTKKKKSHTYCFSS